ncbi:hypothetical protein TNCV_3093961 [Trichonephila clavipes]|nr:hypothetical protein TNCV_3093961 [Trichonephila clavipes]
MCVRLSSASSCSKRRASGVENSTEGRFWTGHSMVEWKRRDRRMLPSPGDVPQLIRAADNHPRWHEAEERPPSVGQWHT